MEFSYYYGSVGDRGSSNFVVVEGFGDVALGLAACNLVMVVQYFGCRAEADQFAAEYYAERAWGVDAGGFSMLESKRSSYFVIVRETALLV